MMLMTWYSASNNLHSIITIAQPSGSRDYTLILTITAPSPVLGKVLGNVPVLLHKYIWDQYLKDLRMYLKLGFSQTR